MVDNDLLIYDEDDLKSKIYIIRGVQVMLDFDLAQIYGYETKRFNEQVKNNIERFDDDFRFQLTDWEFKNLMSKFSTSSWGGTRKLPYAFSELGIYTLMTVLKGNLAVTQSKKLLRLFKKLKDFAIQIQNVLPNAEIQTLALQVQNNTEDIRQMKHKMVTHDELSVVIKDFTDPNIKTDYLLFNGQTVEADIAYSEIYSHAKKTIHIIDNYIGLKTLVLLKSVAKNVQITIFSDNLNHNLHSTELTDFQKEYPNVTITLRTLGGTYHDRYIFIDSGTSNEMIFHCGGSSKDGGKRVTSITKIEDSMLYQDMINSLKSNPVLIL